ncbi:hypothetical protein [Elizabethkingia anophelis]|uniref:hypothetical protein n=1 Tax=Elizabethkingia anophelis TaxID=1117645 RepID=UPI001316A265|nr:hypothetical protein [Elizabethkingia anophelis]BBQ09253.1 hypothetical protein JUNP353_3824 [Elizabethkingia anophelis]
MKTLEQIKDEVAKDFGYESFEQFDDKSTFSYDHKTPKIIDEIAKRYAREVAQASLHKAAENLVQAPFSFNSDFNSQKIAIKNPKNITLL